MSGHMHEFTQCSGGTLVPDAVRFRVSNGLPMRTLMVQPDLLRIFRYCLDRPSQILGKASTRSELLQLQDSTP